MTITLFGSSFNPPHLGHALVIQDFIDAGLTDELWLLPNIRSAFGKNLEAASHRLKMSSIFCEYLAKNIASNRKDNPKSCLVKMCNIESDLKLSGQTFDSINAIKHTTYATDSGLLKTNEGVKFQFLMGSDQLPKFHLWHNYLGLLAQMTFYVYPRVGHPLTNLHKDMVVLNSSNQAITNISSTMIRNRISNSLSVNLLLPNSITKYIQSNQLYHNNS